MPKASSDAVLLYRPVGEAELALVRAALFRAWPARLPRQPTFYQVTSEDYARQIARDWNTRDAASGYTGYVTRFAVRKAFLDQYELHKVGSSAHLEYWIPAADLSEFNKNLVGPIEVIARFGQQDGVPTGAG